MIPTFQQLRFLCALAELRHFGKAAESCAVTQSTLRGGIRELEARLGVALFDRSHRTVMLTPVGKEIAASAQRLLTNAEERAVGGDWWEHVGCGLDEGGGNVGVRRGFDEIGQRARS
jgi:hypothetical protein